MLSLLLFDRRQAQRIENRGLGEVVPSFPTQIYLDQASAG